MIFTISKLFLEIRIYNFLLLQYPANNVSPVFSIEFILEEIYQNCKDPTRLDNALSDSNKLK